MKPRSTLTAAEIDALMADLGRRLEGVGVETQPEVAAKVLSLVSDPNSGLRQFAEVIKADPALSGRMLRLANSALFAQYEPVTNLERACVLLGLERLKALSLGFYLSRAAAGDAEPELSRRIWGQSVYRACLATELARLIVPARAPEAFVVGLLLDAGVPLLVRLLGPPAAAIVSVDRPPARQFIAECQALPFTHVDVAAAMAKKWRLPELLTRPIERHHTPPKGGVCDAAHLLHRVAYYVGSVHLGMRTATEPASALPPDPQRLLGLTVERLGEVARRAAAEYREMQEMFRDVADPAGSAEEIVERVQRQLVEAFDRTMESQLRSETGANVGSFRVAGQSIEIEMDRQGLAIAYLSDAEGNRLLSYAFRPGAEGAMQVLDALGIDVPRPGDADELDLYLRRMAA